MDACVVGAGIAGLTTALRLVRQGLKVVILDKWELAGGETGLTSAHLSHALDDGFENLKKAHGINGLRLAFESHAWAIDEIERVAAEFSIPCDFGRVER